MERKRIACIGSRETPKYIREWISQAGGGIVRAGYVLVSGNSRGADQAWAAGGNSIDSQMVELHLPWAGFEANVIDPGNTVRIVNTVTREGQEAYRIAAILHPHWALLTPGAKSCLARNVRIVHGAACVFGYINPRKAAVGGGGTGFAFKIADYYAIPRYDVASEHVRDKFMELL